MQTTHPEYELPTELVTHLRSLHRMVYYVTEEEDVAIKALHHLLTEGSKNSEVRVYNQAYGLLNSSSLINDWESRSLAKDQATLAPPAAFESIYKEDTRDKKHFYIITDPERWLRDPTTVRRLLNIVHQVRHRINIVKCLIFVGSSPVIPAQLSTYIHVVRGDKPSQDQIHSKLETISRDMGRDFPHDASRWFRGLTFYETESAVSRSLIETRIDANGEKVDPRLDKTIIQEYKRDRIKKTDLLNVVDVSGFDFTKVGGLDKFKSYAERVKPAWTAEGKKFGLRPPKGVLCVGVWGCGKSLSVKALGSTWNLPVIQLEMGKLRSSAVGETEANVYKAISYLESMAPCVTGDTEVTLASGERMTIEDIWHQVQPGETLSVQCWDEEAFCMSTTEVSHVTRREADAFKVSMSHGFEIQATVNHQHYVMRGGMPEWVRTDELQPGDMMAVTTQVYPGDNDCSRYHPPGVREYLRTDGVIELRRGSGGWTDSALEKLPVSWSVSLGWLLGALQGDGHLGTRGAVGLTNTSEVILNKFEACLQTLFGLTPIRRDVTSDATADLPGLSEDPHFKTCWLSQVTSKLACDFLMQATRGILSAPPQVRAAFLAGWVDTDGCIRPEKVILTIKGPRNQEANRSLARAVVQSLGVVPSKFDSKNMEVTGSRATLLASWIQEHLVAKGLKASQVIHSEIGFDRDHGFACGAVLKAARKESGKTFKSLGVPTGTNRSQENGAVLVSERYLSQYVESFPEAKDLKKLQDADCRWVRVQTVQPLGNHVVYDLCCKGDAKHSFVANGLITHNCIAWVDEAEKSFAGAESSGRSDAGTTARTLGILSTWHQETDSEVCLCLTANSLDTLPIEFTNRIEDRFFFDVPSEDDRVEILKIQLKSQGHLSDSQIEDMDLRALAQAAENLVPREMEQAIRQALRDSFFEDKASLDYGILLKEFSDRPRILQTMDRQVQHLLDWIGYDAERDEGVRARMASSRRSKNTLEIIQGGTTLDVEGEDASDEPDKE